MVGCNPRLLQSRRPLLKTLPNLKPRMLINRYLAFSSLSHLKCIYRTEVVGSCCWWFLNMCRVRGYIQFQKKHSINLNLPLKPAIWSQDIKKSKVSSSNTLLQPFWGRLSVCWAGKYGSGTKLDQMLKSLSPFFSDVDTSYFYFHKWGGGTNTFALLWPEEGINKNKSSPF